MFAGGLGDRVHVFVASCLLVNVVTMIMCIIILAEGNESQKKVWNCPKGCDSISYCETGFYGPVLASMSAAVALVAMFAKTTK